MARTPKDGRTAREDDYRDYDARNVDSGWPYADEDATGSPGNRPYGSGEANPDRAGDPGMEAADGPAIESSGEAPSPASERSFMDDDALSERIFEALQAEAWLDAGDVTVRVKEGVAILSGFVDTPQDQAGIINFVRSIPDVRDVVTDLATRGVDSYIPRDSDT
jgi:Predicted periplasmic or secreted lipoprotein